MSVKRTLSSLVITKTSHSSNKVFSHLPPLCTLVRPLTRVKVVWEEVDFFLLRFRFVLAGLVSHYFSRNIDDFSCDDFVFIWGWSNIRNMMDYTKDDVDVVGQVSAKVLLTPRQRLERAARASLIWDTNARSRSRVRSGRKKERM